jgi:hypothetical protein
LTWRWFGIALACSALTVLVAAPATAATAAKQESTAQASRGGEVLKAGWWWVANQPPAETGLVAHPQPSPPNVPAGHLPVAASGGEPDKVTAVELRLSAKPGAMVSSAEVVLQESTAPGANVNAEAAKILACPVTEAFWADGTAARWDAKPDYDCDAAQAAGARDAKGRWTFDLTGIAATWVGEGATGSPSFVLVEGAEAPDSFQVTFAPVSEGGVTFIGKYLPPTEVPGVGGTGALAGAGGALATGGSSSAGLGSTGGAGLSSGSLGAGAGVPVEAPSVTEGTAETTAPVETATTPVAAPTVVPPWYSGLPKATFLLVPFALGLAYLAMLALGPDAQPAVGTSRHGVSRALERLRQAGAQAVAGVRR